MKHYCEVETFSVIFIEMVEVFKVDAVVGLDNVSVGKIVDLPSIIYVDGQVDGRL